MGMVKKCKKKLKNKNPIQCVWIHCFLLSLMIAHRSTGHYSIFIMFRFNRKKVLHLLLFMPDFKQSSLLMVESHVNQQYFREICSSFHFYKQRMWSLR